MPVAAKRRPRRQARSDDSRAKILHAAIELVGEVGPFGLTLALVAERAEVSRALPTYQFHTRDELLLAAATVVLGDAPTTYDLGLEPLLGWIRDELDGARAPSAPLRARLAFLLGPADPSTREAIATHWASHTDLIRRHLERGRALQEIRVDLDVDALAATLFSQLHGEMARLAEARGAADPDVFLALTRTAIAATVAPKRQPSRRPHAQAEDQPQLL